MAFKVFIILLALIVCTMAKAYGGKYHGNQHERHGSPHGERTRYGDQYEPYGGPHAGVGHYNGHHGYDGHMDGYGRGYYGRNNHRLAHHGCDGHNGEIGYFGGHRAHN